MIITDLLELGSYPTQDQLENAKLLIQVVNVFEDFLGLKLTPTNGIRSMQKHVEIYEGLRKKDIKAGKPPRPIPLGSQHLKGNAVDFVCKKLAIKDLQNIFLSEDLIFIAEQQGAYFEDWEWLERNGYKSDWIHLQRVAPLSGKRFFRPF